ncbi:MAG: PDZ domain-containing protein [Planctomycetota bacterium]
MHEAQLNAAYRLAAQPRPVAWLTAVRAGLLRACLVAGALHLCGSAWADPVADQPDPALLIEQLESDDFTTRQSAQTRLAAMGPAALHTVAGAAAGDSLEGSSRAVAVLMQWAEDESHAELRLEALEALAGLKNRPLEAGVAQEHLAVVREQEAVAELTRLGAELGPVNSAYVFPNNRVGVQMQVTIGSSWRGGKEGLRHLADVRSAAKVSLYTPDADDLVLETLASIPNLRALELFGTGVTPEGLAELKRLRPGLEPDVRLGARLGIGDGQFRGEKGALIGRVMVNSPAARAGLRPNDLILKIDGEEVENFKSLTDLIKGKQPGDSVELVVRKGEEERLVEVTFDAWQGTPKFVGEQRAIHGGHQLRIVPTAPPILPNAKPAPPKAPAPAEDKAPYQQAQPGSPPQPIRVVPVDEK